MSEDELQNKSRLAAAQNEGRMSQIRQKMAAAKSKAAQAKEVLSFGKKISEHWYILVAALIFDAVALIPFLCVLANILFGALLFLHFGSKKKAGSSELKNIVLPVAAGSVIDFFLSVFPANLAAALIRIAIN